MPLMMSQALSTTAPTRTKGPGQMQKTAKSLRSIAARWRDAQEPRALLHAGRDRRGARHRHETPETCAARTASTRATRHRHARIPRSLRMRGRASTAARRGTWRGSAPTKARAWRLSRHRSPCPSTAPSVSWPRSMRASRWWEDVAVPQEDPPLELLLKDQLELRRSRQCRVQGVRPTWACT